MKILLLSLFVSLSVLASDNYEISYEKLSQGHGLNFTLKNYSLINQKHGGVTYTSIDFDGVKSTERGFAELPVIGTALALDNSKDFDLKVVSSSFEDIKLEHALLPSKGVVKRNQNIDLIPYKVESRSIVNSFYPREIAKTSAPFILREVRGMSIFLSPFTYNAATRTLRVYKDLRVELTANTRSSTNPLKVRTAPNAVMNSIYQSLFVNYEAPSRLNLSDRGDLLVITTARDEAAIAPYIDWKIQKGFNVSKIVVAKGTNVKSIVKAEYAKNPKLLYVQIVGDWEDIKSDLGPDSAPIDPMLGAIEGKDNFAEVIIGRFSAKSAADVTVQVDKTIAYEKSPDMTGDWYKNSMGIGSNEGAGAGDDGEADYVHLGNIFKYRLNPTTYDTQFEMYATKNATAQQVFDNVNKNGVGLINYTGHGSHDNWTTTGFGNSHISKLTNGNRLPVIVSVACVNGEFHLGGDAFAEAWLKKKGGGAAAMWAATINQPWAPPMRGQDYFNDLLSGGFDYTKNAVGKGINTTEGRSTFGALTANASHLMLTESSSSSDIETVQTWTVFGDVTLQVRSDSPARYNVNHVGANANSPFVITLETKSGEPVKNAIVSMSKDGKSFSATSNEDGSATISSKLAAGTYTLTISGFNLETQVSKVVVK
jgi:hypothetical protein